MNFFDFFKKIGAWFKSDRAKNALRIVDEVADVAIPIAKTLALLTPTTLDDMAIKVAEKYAIQLDSWLKLPQDQKGPELMKLLVSDLKQKFPNVPLNIIQSGAQLAVTAIKNQ